MNEAQQALHTAGLQDIATDSVKETLTNIQGRSSKFCDVEYGLNSEDGRLVFHFFPPGHAADNRKDWADWRQFRDRLETAILGTFDPKTIEAGWAEELKSFFLIANHPGAPDLVTYLSKFFERLETEG